MKLRLDNRLRPARGSNVVPTRYLSLANHVGTSVTDQGSGWYRVTKPGGDVGWDSLAIASEAMAGDFLIETLVPNGDKGYQVGVDPAPTADVGSNHPDHSILFAGDTNTYASENGAWTNMGVHAGSQTWKLQRVGSSLTYVHPSSGIVQTRTYSSAATARVGIFDTGVFIDVRITVPA